MNASATPVRQVSTRQPHQRRGLQQHHSCSLLPRRAHFSHPITQPTRVMPTWEKSISLCLHPLEADHYAVGSIRETSQRSYSHKCVGAAVDTTFWRAVVVGIQAGDFFELYKQVQCFKVQITSKGDHFESNVARPLKSDLHQELFPSLVLQLPLSTSMFNIDITLITCGGSKPITPITFRFDVKTYGYRPGTSEKERYTTLSYPPSLLLPDAHGRVELWKRWSPRQKIVAVPAIRAADMTKKSSDPRTTNGSQGPATSSKPPANVTAKPASASKDSKRKRASCSDGSDHEESRVVDLTSAVLSKKARKRLDQIKEIHKAATVPPSPVGSGARGPIPDRLTFLQNVNGIMQRELQCLKEFEKSRQLKNEVDQLRSQLGLPPGDPLGLEAQMAAMGFSAGTSNVTSPNHSQQASTPQPHFADFDMANEQTDGRRSSRPSRLHDSEADTVRWAHDKWVGSDGQRDQIAMSRRPDDDAISVAASDGGSTSSKRHPQPVISADRLRMLAERANDPPEPAGGDVDGNCGRSHGYSGTGANSTGFTDSADGQGPLTPRPKRRWGGAQLQGDSGPAEDTAVREQREAAVDQFVAQMQERQANQTEALQEAQVHSTTDAFSPVSVGPRGCEATIDKLAGTASGNTATEEHGTEPTAPSVGPPVPPAPLPEEGEVIDATVKASAAGQAADDSGGSTCVTPPPRQVKPIVIEPIEIIEIQDSPRVETLGGQDCDAGEVEGHDKRHPSSMDGAGPADTVTGTPFPCTNPYVSPISVRNQDQDRGAPEVDSPLAHRGSSARSEPIMAVEGTNPYDSPMSVRKADGKSVAMPTDSPLAHRTSSATAASMATDVSEEELSGTTDMMISSNVGGDDLRYEIDGGEDMSAMDATTEHSLEEGEAEDRPPSTPNRMDEQAEHDELFGELSVVDFATTPPTRKRSNGRSPRKPSMRDDIGSWD